MAQQAEASISGLREQIKGKPLRSSYNAVMLFPDQVANYQNRDLRLPAANAFTVIVKKTAIPAMGGVGAGYYTAYLAYHDGGPRKAATGGETDTVVDALHSLLDVLAFGLFESGKMFIAENNVKWVEYGDGEMMENNAVLLFPIQVRNHQNGNPQIRGAEAFAIIVTKALLTRHSAHMVYRAYITYHDGCFNRRAANGDIKNSAVEALQSLLDTTALALAADLESFMVPGGSHAWEEYDGGSVQGVLASPTSFEDGYNG
ncbi:hypothetical protein LTS10_008547 [Elasticomyces elasticus]|nr:hypothetical protein LTS10_008547 [Elasticomyces elasticus]